MNTQKQIFTIIGLILVLGLLWYMFSRANQQGQESSPAPVAGNKTRESSAITQPSDATNQSTTVQQPTITTPPPTTVQAPKESQPQELKEEDITLGQGTAAKTGDTVVVQYIGTLTDGRKFDSSYDRNEPFTFTLGAGQVIRGWDSGIQGMKVGGKRKLTIPASLAYGEAGAPGSIIGPNETLIFEVSLLSIK